MKNRNPLPAAKPARAPANQPLAVPAERVPSFLPYLGQIIVSLISQLSRRSRIRDSLEDSSSALSTFFPSRPPSAARIRPTDRRSF